MPRFTGPAIALFLIHKIGIFLILSVAHMQAPSETHLALPPDDSTPGIAVIPSSARLMTYGPWSLGLCQNYIE